MPIKGTPEISRENEEQNKGANHQREQMEQQGKREETPGLRGGVDKLFPIRRHEKPDGTNG